MVLPLTFFDSSAAAVIVLLSIFPIGGFDVSETQEMVFCLSRLRILTQHSEDSNQLRRQRSHIAEATNWGNKSPTQRR